MQLQTKGARHLLWIAGGTAAGFFASFLFGDVLHLPVDLYYVIYFAVVAIFLWLYVRSTHLDLRGWLSNRIVLGVILGVAVGVVMLYTLPWIVTWRAFAVRGKSLGRKIGFGFLAWAFVLVITTGYHLGYSDFRTRKIVQPNIGSTIMTIPTIVSGNPVSSPITHVFLHVTAVVHSPETDLFLPPHRSVKE